MSSLDRKPRQERVPPRASVLIESMRDIGYSLQTAVSDVIDNSIAAGASNIELLANTNDDVPAIGVLDDGCGMSKCELIEAMRPGTRSPLESRSKTDLGRFGLGLKTASFSQCRKLTVITRKAGVLSCAEWDLDTVAETDDWYINLPSSVDDLPWVEKLPNEGTLVIWRKLDRLVDPDTSSDRSNLIRQIDETASHLELVFHRFLSGEPGLKRVSMKLNGRELDAFDPFHSKHPATIRGQKESFRLGNSEITIQPMTLPHHKKLSAEDWERYAGEQGYLRNQGFYVYRAKRLIIYGTWFNLVRQTELTKLARVRIDIPNGMDAEWKIDVKKSSAQPPPPVRERLRKIIDKIGASSKRVYTLRGKKLVSEDRLPVWTRSQDKNEIRYGLDLDHPAFNSFRSSLNDAQMAQFTRLMRMIEATVPVDALFADVSADPQSVSTRRLDEEELSALVRQTYMTLRSQGLSGADTLSMIVSAEPFKSNRKFTERTIQRLEEENYHE